MQPSPVFPSLRRFFRPSDYCSVLFTFVVIAAGFWGCNLEPKTINIATLKSLANSPGFASTSREIYYLKGYYYDDQVPMLVSDLKWVLSNRLMPDSAYVILQLDSKLRITMKNRSGKLVSLKGQLANAENRVKNLREDHSAGFVATEFIEISSLNAGNLTPGKLSISTIEIQNNSFRNQSRNYALLYSGGYDLANAHSRYWNDLSLMYATLKDKYGYPADHIIVVYKNGFAENSNMPVNYPASPAGLQASITFLKNRLNKDLDLFVFVTNHGGGYDLKEGRNMGGIADASRDENDPYMIDEAIFYYDQKDIEVDDDFFCAMLNSLKLRKLIGILEPCYSGGFLRDLRGKNHITISACSELEQSYSNATATFDIFSYYFTTALLGKENGKTIMPAVDLDKDGKVSILEAFNYAKTKDSMSESPHLEDNGDGVGALGPVSIPGKDGFLASKTFLN